MIDRITKVRIECKGGDYKVYDVPSSLDIELVTKKLQEEQDYQDSKFHTFKLKEDK